MAVANLWSRPGRLLGLGFALLSVEAVYAACPPIENGAGFAAKFDFDIKIESANLIAVHQAAGDFKAYVDADISFWINHAGDRNSREYLLLEQAKHGDSAKICLYPAFEQSAPGRAYLEELALEPSDARQLDALRSLNTAGSLWQRGDTSGFEQARVLYEGLAQLSLPGEHQFEFDMQLFAAIAKVKLLQYDSAVPALEALLGKYGSHPDIYKVHFQLGKVFLRQRDIPEAIEHLQLAEDLLSSADSAALEWLRFERAEVRSWLGEAHVHAGDLDAANAKLELAIADASPDFSLLGRIFDNKGLVGIRRGEARGISKAERERWYAESTEDHLKGIYFSQGAGDRETLQLTENNVAIHYARIGERRKSIVHFLNVLRMLDEVDNPEWRGLLLGNLSNYLQILGDYSKSLAYLQEAVRYATPGGNDRFATYFCRMGMLLELLGEAEAGTAELQRCLELATENDDPFTQVDARLQMSRRLLAQGEHAAAVEMFAPGLELLAALDDFQLTKRARIHEARLLLETGRAAEADDAVQAAFAADLNDIYPNQTIEALELAMRAQLSLGNTDEAFAFGERAMKMIESLHTQLEAERIGPAWNNQTSSLYETVTAAHLERYRDGADPEALRAAFVTMERSRDISLRQRLAAGLPNDSATLEEEKRLALYSSMSNLLAQAGHESELPAMRNLDYYHQHDLLSLARLSEVDTVPVPEPADLPQVQQRLADDQLVLYYVNTGQQLNVMAVTREDFALTASVPMQEVVTLLEAVDADVDGSNTVSIESLRALSRMLVPDLSAWPEATELLIVPHTGLYALPFAALTQAVDGAPYQPLIATYSLKMLPSLSSYLMRKERRDVEHSTSVAILADPVFGAMQVTGAMPSQTTVADAWRGWSDSLQPLPFTASEAANIASLFPGRTVSYTGPAANRRNLSGVEARNAKVLHIATHGYFASTSEDNLGLALSTIDEEGNADPGFITLTELFGYAFNNELVVISGCETAMGKELAGVGMNGLTRGFLAQGVKHVISTLWPVSDRASAEFMQAFYRHLGSSGNVAGSLQQAQLELSRNPDYRNPYYWAGYLLTTVEPDATLDLTR